MSTIGDVERALANLYEYRWAIGAATLVLIAAALAFAYWRGWHLIVLRHRVAFGIAAVPVLAITLWIGWSLGSPLFTNVTVEEEFPFALNAAVPEGMERTDVEEVLAGMAMVEDPVMREEMPPASVIDAGAMMEAGEPITAVSSDDYDALMEGFTMVRDVADMEMSEQSAGMEPDMEIAELSAGMEMVEQGAGMMEPVIMAMAAGEDQVRAVKQGDFRDADSFHRGSGQATIFTTPDGGHLLRLENLDVTNGPALHVFLSPHQDPTSPEEVKLEGYVDLGGLKGNRGNQNYPIPAGLDVSVFNSVVIYCKPFSVVFSVAPLGST